MRAETVAVTSHTFATLVPARTAFQKMKEWKLRDPVIVEEGNYVKVTIPHAPLATPEDAILEYLEVRLLSTSTRRDPDIAHAAVDPLGGTSRCLTTATK